ncbi:MAG: helix-turn-helix domain-containing protein [Verrucomicrobiia bacterium]
MGKPANCTTNETNVRQVSDTVGHRTANETQRGLPRLAYSMRETAEILGVDYITVHRLLKRGLLRSSSALRTKVIPLVEIERFLTATTK